MLNLQEAKPLLFKAKVVDYYKHQHPKVVSFMRLESPLKSEATENEDLFHVYLVVSIH